MPINTNNTCMKQRLSPASGLLRSSKQLPFRTKWDLSRLPFRIHASGFTVKHAGISSQVTEKMRSKVVIKDYVKGKPLSSSYENAMEALSSLISSQKRGDRSSLVGKHKKMDRMHMYLKILELEDYVTTLKIIHVAGTKGKGSTCTFCEAILRECGFQTGLFTSPHLIDVRERFRVNGLDISEDSFLYYFWDCWNILKEKITDDLPMPPLFQFLFVLALKIFICEKVDVAIVEVGMGGKNDSTNVIKEPVVCGITSLGMDHTEILGDTIKEIAMHKAGIFKPKIPAFTVPQRIEAMDVLEGRACELMVPLNVAVPLENKKLDGLKLGLSGDHQFINAGLAVSLCKSWLQRTENWGKLFPNQNDRHVVDLPEPFMRGLSTACLPGRAQIVHDTSLWSSNSSEVAENPCGDLVFYLDGAHSPESMDVCARWFSNAVKVTPHPFSLISKVGFVEEFPGNVHVQHEKGNNEDCKKISKQILLFNCMAVREPQILLPRLVNICASSGTHFSKALFVPSMSSYNRVISGSSIGPSDNSKDLSWQFNLQRIWEKVIRGEDTLPDKITEMDYLKVPLSHKFRNEKASRCHTIEEAFVNSTVFPSLPLTIKWLRNCVRENPSLKLEVLVTGSLHLVGDVLKMIRR